ncbi:DUF523 domain-containing protein [Rhizobium mesosinicum]|uniref:DUF523 domain-containing protein n=1 Tax=Rhizobium mesosinicum TaxID=335017 RepID=A0ABS7H4J9_9HYPH|nr:DUF523 domain-containing protein [Rhizobium mesosinicum]MBW9056503.1 DUF523 domain-containing protein [Rhizobium mesosinicum]
MVSKILVSACLMGHAVRYDGGAKPLAHPAIERWMQEGLVVTICPEMSAGMPVPRPPAEIGDATDGEDVLAGTGRVVELTGGDVTEEFLRAAENAVRLATDNGCRYALLIDGSPSCGSGFIYDGSFSGSLRAGNGVTAAALKQAGLEVFSDREIDQLIERIGPNSTAAEDSGGR